MREQITMYRDMYEFYKDTKSKRLFIAFAEYLFEGIEPTDLKWIEITIFNSLKIRMENQRKKAHSWAMWWATSHWWWRPWNTSSELKQETSKKQANKQTKNKEDKDNITNVILLREKEIKEKTFDDFWTAYPHARKWKKQESKNYFLKQNPDEVMKQVQILKRKLKAWLIESKYIPACERWIRDFTPINDDVINQDLVKICRWHLNAWWDMKERSLELKQTFWEERIDSIVKAIQQKNTLSLI